MLNIIFNVIYIIVLLNRNIYLKYYNNKHIYILTYLSKSFINRVCYITILIFTTSYTNAHMY